MGRSTTVGTGATVGARLSVIPGVAIAVAEGFRLIPGVVVAGSVRLIPGVAVGVGESGRLMPGEAVGVTVGVSVTPGIADWAGRSVGVVVDVGRGGNVIVMVGVAMTARADVREGLGVPAGGVTDRSPLEGGVATDRPTGASTVGRAPGVAVACACGVGTSATTGAAVCVCCVTSPWSVD